MKRGTVMENVKEILRNYILEHFEIEADDPDFADDPGIHCKLTPPCLMEVPERGTDRAKRKAPAFS